jgi:hypothetical protein
MFLETYKPVPETYVDNLNFDPVANSVYDSNKKMVEIYNDGKQNIIDRTYTIYTDFINVNK